MNKNEPSAVRTSHFSKNQIVNNHNNVYQNLIVNIKIRYYYTKLKQKTKY